MAWTAPRTWVAGETVTAALLNTHVRDNLEALSTWSTYSTTWAAASVNPSIGNGTLVARYISAGKLVHWYVYIKGGSTTSWGTGSWSVTLPVAAVSTRLWTWQGGINDQSGGLYPCMGYVQTGGTVVDLRTDPTTAGNTVRGVNSGIPLSWATNDELFIGGTYEAA